MNEPRYPQVHVKLVGEDGNAYAILGRCQRAARRAGINKEEVKSFMSEATSGDYNNLLNTCQDWFNCDPDEDAQYEEE